VQKVEIIRTIPKIIDLAFLLCYTISVGAFIRTPQHFYFAAFMAAFIFSRTVSSQPELRG
jgi:hypothetical protein